MMIFFHSGGIIVHFLLKEMQSKMDNVIARTEHIQEFSMNCYQEI